MADRNQIALMTSLPVLWAEEPDIGSMLRKDEAPPHWGKPLLERRGTLHPLDRIADKTLRGLDLAVLIQPRTLAPEEMVALDRWVRGGGRLLLFADPMLDVHSAFALGDKRRPHAIAMVDPLLTHWGLELHYDEVQGDGVRLIKAEGLVIPVSRAGRLEARGKKCRVGPDMLVAQCRIGRGRALIVADADMFDQAFEHQEAQISALNGLLALVENSR